jgi:pyruvate dehydrogenase complex dehydrogenase (E1) component
VVVAVLAALASQGLVDHRIIADAIAEYGIDPDGVDPYLV